MQNRDHTYGQGGQGQGTQKPGQGGGQQGGRESQPDNPKPRQGGRQGPTGGDKPTTRPTPSGVPNEGRGRDTRTGQAGYEYKGGRQGTGGVPNPDDSDDGESAGSFRGTAGRREKTDDEVDDNQANRGSGQDRKQTQKSDLSDPE